MPRSRRTVRRRSTVAAALASIALVAVATSQAIAARPAADPVIVAVGDLACQSFSQGSGEGACRSDEIADLITGIAPTRFLALGDLQYNKGTLDEFQRVWDQQFGHLGSITQPAPGNHEYGTPGAQGYFDYWGPIANPTLGYYSFNLGSWHIVSLNSDICGDEPGCGPGTPQYEWLKADLLDASGAVCTLAFQHHPRYDWRPFQKWIEDDGTTQNGGTETAPYIEMWRLMDGAGVDVLLAGHNHLYQRWAPQDADGNRSPTGIRQFTVGTGGRSLYPFGPKPQPANLQLTQNKSFGVLKMALHEGSYDYGWVSVPGEPSFADRGTGIRCT
jgi:hypothetical protein